MRQYMADIERGITTNAERISGSTAAAANSCHTVTILTALMFVKRNCLTCGKRPASSSSASALKTIAAANLIERIGVPVVSVAENHGRQRQVVRIFYAHVPCGVPQTENNMQI